MNENKDNSLGLSEMAGPWDNPRGTGDNPHGDNSHGDNPQAAGGASAGESGNDNNSNSSSNKPNNPWSSPTPENAGSKNTEAPISIEQWLKRGIDSSKIRRSNGGGGGGGSSGGGRPSGLPDFSNGRKLVQWFVVAALVLWIGGTSVHIIPPAKEGVVTRFGGYARTVPPGLQWTLPRPIERVQMEDVLAIRTLLVGSPQANDDNFVLTQDQNIIDMAYEVRWSIREPDLYLFEIADQEGTIRDVAESSMRATVANYDLSQALGPGRSDIEQDVQRRTQELLDEYRAGVQIQGVAIRQADPPQQVNEAFKEVTTARQQRESALNDARAFAQRVIEGARGETAEFNKIYEEYRLAPEVTRRRLYYETMESVLANVDKTIVEPNEVTPYLPLNQMNQRRALPAPSSSSNNR